MKCPTCGGDNREGARFCRHCGVRMEASADQRPGLEEKAPAEPSQAPEPASGQEALATQETGREQSAPAESEQAPAAAEVEAPAEAPAEPKESDAPAGVEVSAEAPVEADEVSVASGFEDSAEASAEPKKPAAATEVEASAGGVAKPLPIATAPSSESGEPREVCLTPVPLGTVLDGRYLVIEVLDRQPAQIRYAARDLCRCWQCGFDANAADDAYCARCGASLAGRRAIVPLVQVPDAQAHPPEGESLAARLVQGDAYFLVLEARPPKPGPASAPAGGLRLLLGQATHPGQVRPLNEDSLLSLVLTGSSLRSRPDESQGQPLVLGLFAVADGMGGHEGGEVASKLALHVFGDEVVRAILSPAVEGHDMLAGGISALLGRAVEAANDAVYLARQKRESDMGTTLTAALVLDDRLFLVHVGDCRALRFGATGLEQLTADHSLIASLVAAGRATPDEVYSSPQRSAILRCIGDRPTVQVDTAELPLSAGDRLVLCSDGLWEMLHNEGIADVLMQESDPQEAADLLVARANLAGGDDNITVVVVQVESA